MSGVRLRELEASDLLDVLHFLFIQDNSYNSEEQMKSQSAIRTSVYEKLYGTTYKYQHHDKSSALKGPNGGYIAAEDLELMPEDEAIKPFDPKTEPTKPFVPATKFDPEADLPFGKVLGAPLG
jgi:hypothetical protein